MNNLRENYRENVSVAGVLFMGGVEHKMQIHNLSIVSILASIEPTADIRNEQDILKITEQSKLVDIYIKTINIAGEAEIVRVEMKDKEILISMVFKQVSYNAESLLYKRKVYRKAMNTPGKILVFDTAFDFVACNVSVSGLMIRIPGKADLHEGDLVEFKFDELQIHGKAVIVWVEHVDDNGTLVGLEYKRMKKADLSSIPVFYDE